MAKAAISIGKKIPKFKVASTSGGLFDLSQAKGKNVVIYFYPKDNTPGCTTEGNDFKKLYKKFLEQDTLVLGVSRDSINTHMKFIEKQGFPFPLLSDEDESLCQLFDVMKMKSLYGRKFRGVERSTFFIDKKGILREEWRNLKVANHAKEVLEYAEKFNTETK
jgi:thioredoxin-dependent peroxiredoxin